MVQIQILKNKNIRGKKMARERWEEIVALYKTYISILQPLLRETRRLFLDLTSDELLDFSSMQERLEKETKRKIHKVKAIAEFNAFFKKEIFKHIFNYIDEIHNEFDAVDIKDNIIDFLDESILAFDGLLTLIEEDFSKQSGSVLNFLFDSLNEILLPNGDNLSSIYDQLIENSTEWFEAQRHILMTTTFFRENIGEMTIPGLSPKTYQIINGITSLFNLDPNYIDMEENPNYVVPAIMISDVFEPYIDNIANAEEESIKRICNRLELQITDGIFISPTEQLLNLAKPHNYFTTKNDSDGKIRWIPQFSNETFVLLYLAKVSLRRGFISKELINWISMNFAFIIYNTILRTNLSDENIFYNLFLDLKTEEKIIPYLMKLLCFENYLRLDRTKIRDSPVYRKELFNFLGSKIDVIDKITYLLVDKYEKISQKEKFVRKLI
ncbi:MAG: hypothetical protein DRO88_09445 [Promethearchaeia archaeon]|nr:MAG: hypothetical protein DRO88_09445 [Candidatus Lokiarchaeia archaeon]